MARKMKVPSGPLIELREAPPPPEGRVWRLWRVGGTPSCVECGAPTPFYTAPLPAGHARSDHHPPLLFAVTPATAGPEYVDPATALHGSGKVVVVG